MQAGCRLDAQEKSSGFVSENFDVKNRPPLIASLATARRRRMALAGVGLALFFSTYAQADSAAYNYKAHCSACHGATGAGDTMIGKNLKLRPLSSPELQALSDEELFAIISKGKGKGRMPAFERRLTKDQINDLVKYIRSLKK
jgi:mono/diheme cytochrome c family protein